MGSVRTTAMIMMILMGAGFLSLAMGFTGIPRALAEGIEALEPFTSNAHRHIDVVLYRAGVFPRWPKLNRADNGCDPTNGCRCWL